MIHDALQAFEVPGLAIAVVQRDAVTFAQGYGTRTRGDDAPVDEDTLFAVGSISKSFTATALDMLVDDGKFGWDERVQQHLPWFAMHDPYVTREITVRDLLTHRVGLRSVSGGTVWYGSSYDQIEVVRRMRYLAPVSSFRAQFAYQNITYAAAGEIAAAVSGQSWDQFVRERVFAPLGMTRSITAMAELAQRTNVATPHAHVAGTTAPVPHRNYDNVGPAASIYSSARDMAQYLRLHLAYGSFDGQQLIAPATAHEMHAPQMVIPIEPWPAALAALKPTWYTYGLGWFVRDYGGRKLVQHAGGVDGMVALATMLRCWILATINIRW
jgi:CubicO group peptidase (beta-lactamase class C family)